jgi:phosphoribosyl-dephospho-CoA transferase
LRGVSVNLPLPRVDAPLRRHELVRVYPAGWESLLRARADLAGVPLLQDWATRGWPLIARRRAPSDGAGVLLGLPLPPSLGKRRISVEMRVDDVAQVSALPSLSDVIGTAPVAWRPFLSELIELARIHDVRAGVFGSLYWQWVTGLVYLQPHSDLDVVWTLPRAQRLERFLGDLAAVDARAPMRLDGELMRADGAAVNWRELCAGGEEIVLRSASRVRLCARLDFIRVAS